MITATATPATSATAAASVGTVVDDVDFIATAMVVCLTVATATAMDP